MAASRGSRGDRPRARPTAAPKFQFGHHGARSSSRPVDDDGEDLWEEEEVSSAPQWVGPIKPLHQVMREPVRPKAVSNKRKGFPPSGAIMPGAFRPGAIVPLSKVPAGSPPDEKKPKLGITYKAEPDMDYELDFLFFLEEHLRENPQPMCVKTMRQQLIPKWIEERPGMDDAKMSRVQLSQAIIHEYSDSLVWIVGPMEDRWNTFDFVAWDPEHSQMAMQKAKEAAEETGDVGGPIMPSSVAIVPGGKGVMPVHNGVISGFSMMNGFGFITPQFELPGVGRQIPLSKGALPGVLSTFDIGEHPAMRQNTWFKGQPVKFSVDVSMGKPLAKDLKFARWTAM